MMASASARFASTAKWIAAARANESARPDRLFSDPFAGALAGEAGAGILARSEAASGGENPFLPVRTRYLDDLLLAAGAPQAVLLGAGLDTRAYRLAIGEQTRVFELDRAEVLDEKDRILSGLGAHPLCRRQTVPTNLAGPWMDDLTAAGFDAGVPAVWIAEGLFYYLDQKAVRRLLRGARQLSAVGSMFAADVFGTGILEQPQIKPYLQWLETVGLPPPFATDDPSALFASSGWAAAKITEPGDADANYGRLAVRPVGAVEGSNRAYLVSASASLSGGSLDLDEQIGEGQFLDSQ